MKRLCNVLQIEEVMILKYYLVRTYVIVQKEGDEKMSPHIKLLQVCDSRVGWPDTCLNVLVQCLVWCMPGFTEPDAGESDDISKEVISAKKMMLKIAMMIPCSWTLLRLWWRMGRWFMFYDSFKYLFHLCTEVEMNFHCRKEIRAARIRFTCHQTVNELEYNRLWQVWKRYVIYYIVEKDHYISSGQLFL